MRPLASELPGPVLVESPHSLLFQGPTRPAGSHTFHPTIPPCHAVALPFPIRCLSGGNQRALNPDICAHAGNLKPHVSPSPPSFAAVGVRLLQVARSSKIGAGCRAGLDYNCGIGRDTHNTSTSHSSTRARPSDLDSFDDRPSVPTQGHSETRHCRPRLHRYGVPK